MNIKGVNNSYLQYNTQVNKKSSVPQDKPVKEDKLEISTEALQKKQSLDKAKNTEEIQKRINDKFYFSKDVTEKIAERILKDLK